MEGEFFEEMCAFLDDVLEKEGISKEILMHSRYLFITATSKRAKENMLRCIYALVVVIVGFHAVILASRFA